MTYKIVVSKSVTDIIGNIFSVCGCLLIGTGMIALGIFIYKLPDDTLPLPIRVLMFVLLTFMGLLAIIVTILEALGIITVVGGV
jgi:hypothetical protein